MIVAAWNPLVNKRFFTDGAYSYDDEYIKELRMASGKPRVYLANSYVPKVFGDIGLDLDDERVIASVPTKYNTERRQFEYWFDFTLRYGSLPFQIPRLLFPNESGVYQFAPGSLSFGVIGLHTATFALREVQ
jgi:hypothetical protein